MSTRILITGANGFLGGSLFRYLKQNDPQAKVLGLSRRKSKFPSKDLIQCDATDVPALRNVLSDLKPGYIFHCAGGRTADVQQLMDLNIMTTRSLFEALNDLKDARPRVILPGTAAEYGLIDAKVRIVDEKTTPRPTSWYGLTKYSQTLLGLMYAQKGADVVLARIFNICGYGMPETLALGKFAKQIAAIEEGKQEAAIQTGNLSGRRDFLDVEDVCAALMLLAEKGKAGEVYNVASGKFYRIRDLLKKMIRYSAVPKIVVREDKAASAESHDIAGRNSKLKGCTAWQPKTTIDQSLKNTLAFYREDGFVS